MHPHNHAEQRGGRVNHRVNIFPAQRDPVLFVHPLMQITGIAGQIIRQAAGQ